MKRYKIWLILEEYDDKTDEYKDNAISDVTEWETKAKTLKEWDKIIDILTNYGETSLMDDRVRQKHRQSN